MQELKLFIEDAQQRPTIVANNLIHKVLRGHEKIKRWNHRSIICILTYLQGISRPDVSMDVYQCARFSSDHKLSHERAVTRIVRCLIDAIDRSLMCKIDMLRGLEYFEHAYYAGSL